MMRPQRMYPASMKPFERNMDAVMKLIDASAHCDLAHKSIPVMFSGWYNNNAPKELLTRI